MTEITWDEYIKTYQAPPPRGMRLRCGNPFCQETYIFPPGVREKRFCSPTCGKRYRRHLKRTLPDGVRSPEEILAREKEAARQRIEQEQLRKMLQERSYEELLLDNLRTSIFSAGLVFPDEFKRVKAPTPKTRKQFKPEEAVLLLSDVHIGKETRAIEVGGLGEYGLETYIQYLGNLGEAIKEISLIHSQAYALKRLHVLCLGDIVDAQNVYAGHPNYIDLNVTQQIVFGVGYLAQFFVDLLDSFDTIEIDGIVGNHGRTGMKKREQPRYNSYDFIAYTILSLMLSQQSRIKVNIHVPFWALKTICGHDFLLLHGDDIRSWNGIPWYGINRAVANLREVLCNMGKGGFRYICLAHFHSCGDIEGSYGERIINGSFPGCDQYSLEALFSSSEPRQQFFGVNESRGITWRYWIDLRGKHAAKKGGNNSG